MKIFVSIILPNSESSNLQDGFGSSIRVSARNLNECGWPSTSTIDGSYSPSINVQSIFPVNQIIYFPFIRLRIQKLRTVPPCWIGAYRSIKSWATCEWLLSAGSKTIETQIDRSLSAQKSKNKLLKWSLINRCISQLSWFGSPKWRST